MTEGQCTNDKFTTVRISTDTFSKLFVLKHNLELKDKKTYSYDSVIKHILEVIEGLKID